MIEFHSGKRLATARKLKGWMQKQLIDLDHFPHVSLKTIGRWETEGIVQSRVGEVAAFFNVNPWVFLDPALGKSEFEQIIVNPNLQQGYEAKREPKKIADTQSTLHVKEKRSHYQLQKEAIQRGAEQQFTETLNSSLINQQTQEGWSLLFWAAFENQVAMIDLLCQKGANLELVDQEGLTPLLVAAAKGCSGAVQRLLELGAEVNHTDGQGWSALHWSVVSRNVKITGALLDFGANPEVMDIKGRSPLYRAVSCSNIQITECLLKNNANPLTENLQGVSPLRLVQQEKDPKLLQLFAK